MPLIVSSALTFLDTTDQNQLSAYLTSNFATVQTCTSDQNVYSPSWKDTNLELQLHALYDGRDMTAEELKDKVTWYYKDGNHDEQEIENGGYYDITDCTKLVVKDNVIQYCTSDTITFICKVTLSKIDVMTVQMTYTLITDTKAVSFYLGMPDGDTFTNQQGTREIVAYAHCGIETIEAGGDGSADSDKAKFTWYKYNEDGNWVEYNDNNNTSTQLTIQGADVINIASFKCVMKYKGVEYIGVATVRDITDTYISEIFTIGGDVFKNGTGGSAAYVIVRKNGQAVNQTTSSDTKVVNEIDPIKGYVSSIQAEPAYKQGWFWYAIDDENDQIIYKQCSDGKSWTAVSEIPQEFVYTWTLMDKDGNEKNFSNGYPEKTGKVIYVSCSDIDDTGTVQCTVSTKK